MQKGILVIVGLTLFVTVAAMQSKSGGDHEESRSANRRMEQTRRQSDCDTVCC